MFTKTVPNTTLLARGFGVEARDTVFSYICCFTSQRFCCASTCMCSHINGYDLAMTDFSMHTHMTWLVLGLFMSFSALYIFIFCAFRKKGHKKKLNSYLVFGDILDMSQFLQQPGKCTMLITFIL